MKGIEGVTPPGSRDAAAARLATVGHQDDPGVQETPNPAASLQCGTWKPCCGPALPVGPT